MAYPNGEVPLHKLVHLGANFYLPPGTAARWRWLAAEGKRLHGVTFRITPDRDGLGGWNAYRPLDAQYRYRAHYGVMAAVPRFSSHGGFYQGQEVFAIDVDNWSAIRWAQFVELCARAGFRTNFVKPEERWHIGDFNNPWVVPSNLYPEEAAPPLTPNLSEEDEMKLYRWNENHVFGIGREAIYHVSNTATWRRLEKTHGATIEVGNEQLTDELNWAGVHWDAVEAVLNSTGPGAGGKYWSRLMAEGIAIRGNQAAQKSTLQSVLAIAEKTPSVAS